MNEFVYNGQAGRVVFGLDARYHLARELDALKVGRVLVLCTPGQCALADMVLQMLGDRGVGIFDHAAMHVPMKVVLEARDAALRLRADCAVAVGGGSTIGLGKAIALESALPILAMPTTYAGSEMTPIYGITEAGRKRTGKDVRVLPRTTLYDPVLSASLPVGVSITSGINAIAHAAEGLYARDTNPVMALMAEEGIRALGQALPGIVAAPSNLDARGDALYGAWLCGMVLGNVGMALHHKLCHTLGGSFDLPHADTHTVVLPHVLAFNAAAAPQAMQRVVRALGGGGTAATAVFDLARHNGAPTALRDIGMQAHDLDHAADLAVAQPYWNPRPIERNAVRELLQAAWEGCRPQA